MVIKMKRGWFKRVSMATGMLVLALLISCIFIYDVPPIQTFAATILLIIVASPCFAVIDACTHQES